MCMLPKGNFGGPKTVFLAQCLAVWRTFPFSGCAIRQKCMYYMVLLLLVGSLSVVGNKKVCSVRTVIGRRLLRQLAGESDGCVSGV